MKGLGKMEHKPETNPKQGRDGGLGEMGLGDEGEKKNEKEKGGKKRSQRERKRKENIKYFFDERGESLINFF